MDDRHWCYLFTPDHDNKHFRRHPSVTAACFSTILPSIEDIMPIVYLSGSAIQNEIVAQAFCRYRYGLVGSKRDGRFLVAKHTPAEPKMEEKIRPIAASFVVWENAKERIQKTADSRQNKRYL